MLSSWAIRNFLIRQPHAHSIRVTRDGDVQEVVPSNKWSKTADTLRAIEPDLIELLDSEGRVIRASKPADEEDSSASAPTPPACLEGDANAALMTHFANLIHRAYEHSTTVAFSRLIELVERMDARSDAIEARLERTEGAYRRTVQQQIDDAYDRVEDAQQLAENLTPQQQLDLGSLLKVFLNGANQGQARKSASNGKGQAP